MLTPMPFSLFANPRLGTSDTVTFPDPEFRQAKAAITSWNGYAPTPLRELPEVARDAYVAAICLKDEAGRFRLGSFKALGGAYAVACAPLGARVVTCATDGNHGRAVAWGAQRFGRGCVIFVHEAVSRERVDAITHYGAEVRRVPGTYDDAVREAARQAAANGWHVVSDTSWPGYTEVPRLIMQGYRLMADEAADQWAGDPPTHVFIQGGVGGVAAAVSVQMRALPAGRRRCLVTGDAGIGCVESRAGVQHRRGHRSRPVYATGRTQGGQRRAAVLISRPCAMEQR